MTLKNHEIERINHYVEEGFKNIADCSQKTEVMDEIKERFADATEDLMNKGKAFEDAMNKAIVDFGNMDEIIIGLREETQNHSPGEYSKSALMFSVVGSLSIIALLSFINFYYTPDVIWVVYPIFAILWWPLGLFFFGSWRKGRKA